MVKRKGIVIDIIEETPEGDLSISHLEKLISGGPRKPALIAITHIPTNSGQENALTMINPSLILAD